MKVLRLLILALFLNVSFSYAEEAAPSESTPAPATEEKEKTEIKASSSNAAVASEPKASGSSRLVERLRKPDGSVAKMAIITPLDYTTQNFAEAAQQSLVAGMTRFGDIPLQTIDDTIASLTIDEFRRIILKNKVDVAVLMILKPTNFDMFLFDKRTPYQIFAHSEVLPEAVQYQITQAVVEEYSKVILRRVLYAYVQNQSYELPHAESTPVLTSEIPRWVASTQSLQTVNREILSRFYVSAAVGAALSMGNSKMWNSNILGLQAGYKITGRWYGEGTIDLFSYNSFGAGVKYIGTSIDSPFKYSFGLGLSTAMNQHTLNWDQNHTQGIGGSYVVPSAGVMFPIVDIHFKVESKLFVGLGGGKMVFALMPGLFFMF